MKEITSKKTKAVQFITDEEWEWLRANGKARNFTVKEMTPVKKPVMDKDVLMPEVKKPIKKSIND